MLGILTLGPLRTIHYKASHCFTIHLLFITATTTTTARTATTATTRSPSNIQ